MRHVKCRPYDIDHITCSIFYDHILWSIYFIGKKFTYLAADERFLRGIITTPTSDVVICDNLKQGSLRGH